MRTSFAVIAFLVLLVSVQSLPGVLIPLYVYPVVSSVDNWKPVKDAATENPSVPFIAIVNPSSGPGDSKDNIYASAIDGLISAGITCIGYVSTNYGNVPYATATTHMDRYNTWYPQVTGFFLDEMANAGDKQSYYSALTDYANSTGKPFTMGNPGTSVTSDYFDTVSNTVIYETSTLPSVRALSLGFPAERSSMIAYSVPASSVNQTYINTISAYVSWMYITDDTLNNPYDNMPTYWTQFIAYLAAVPGQSPPSPSNSPAPASSPDTPSGSPSPANPSPSPAPAPSFTPVATPKSQTPPSNQSPSNIPLILATFVSVLLALLFV